MDDDAARTMLAKRGGVGEVFPEHSPLHLWREETVNGRSVALCVSCPSWAMTDGDGARWREGEAVCP